MQRHIVIDARQYSSSSGRYVRNLINQLENLDKKNKYSILLLKNDYEDFKPSSSNFSKVLVPFNIFSISEQIKFKKFLESINPDLVHFTFAQQPVLYSGKKVTTIHDLTACRFNLSPNENLLKNKIKRSVYTWMVSKVARDSKVIITPTNYVAKDVEKSFKIDSKKIITTYEAGNSIITEPKSLNIEGDFILYVGRAQPHKNLERLIQAFTKINLQNPNIKLVLAGKKDRAFKNLKQYVDDKSIDNIIFTDFVSDGELKWLYQNAKCYVFPSLSEGFGLPGLEAMAHGAPLASSNETCLPEVFADAAIYFDPFDIQSIAVVVNQVITDKKLANKLRTLGHKRLSCFSWKKMAKETLAIYESVLE